MLRLHYVMMAMCILSGGVVPSVWAQANNGGDDDGDPPITMTTSFCCDGTDCTSHIHPAGQSFACPVGSRPIASCETCGEEEEEIEYNFCCTLANGCVAQQVGLSSDCPPMRLFNEEADCEAFCNPPAAEDRYCCEDLQCNLIPAGTYSACPENDEYGTLQDCIDHCTEASPSCTISITPLEGLCPGSTQPLIATTTYDGGSTNADPRWYVLEGSEILASPSFGIGNSFPVEVDLPLAEGSNLFILAEYFPKPGVYCSAIETTVVPVVQITDAPVQVCAHETMTITANGTPPGGTYHWTLNGTGQDCEGDTCTMSTVGGVMNIGVTYEVGGHECPGDSTTVEGLESANIILADQMLVKTAPARDAAYLSNTQRVLMTFGLSPALQATPDAQVDFDSGGLSVYEYVGNQADDNYALGPDASTFSMSVEELSAKKFVVVGDGSIREMSVTTFANGELCSYSLDVYPLTPRIKAVETPDFSNAQTGHGGTLATMKQSDWFYDPDGLGLVLNTSAAKASLMRVRMVWSGVNDQVLAGFPTDKYLVPSMRAGLRRMFYHIPSLIDFYELDDNGDPVLHSAGLKSAPDPIGLALAATNHLFAPNPQTEDYEIVFYVRGAPQGGSFEPGNLLVHGAPNHKGWHIQLDDDNRLKSTVVEATRSWVEQVRYMEPTVSIDPSDPAPINSINDLPYERIQQVIIHQVMLRVAENIPLVAKPVYIDMIPFAAMQSIGWDSETEHFYPQVLDRTNQIQQFEDGSEISSFDGSGATESRILTNSDGIVSVLVEHSAVPTHDDSYLPIGVDDSLGAPLVALIGQHQDTSCSNCMFAQSNWSVMDAAQQPLWSGVIPDDGNGDRKSMFDAAEAPDEDGQSNNLISSAWSNLRAAKVAQGFVVTAIATQTRKVTGSSSLVKVHLDGNDTLQLAISAMVTQLWGLETWDLIKTHMQSEAFLENRHPRELQYLVIGLNIGLMDGVIGWGKQTLEDLAAVTANIDETISEMWSAMNYLGGLLHEANEALPLDSPEGIGFAILRQLGNPLIIDTHKVLYVKHNDIAVYISEELLPVLQELSEDVRDIVVAYVTSEDIDFDDNQISNWIFSENHFALAAAQEVAKLLGKEVTFETPEGIALGVGYVVGLPVGYVIAEASSDSVLIGLTVGVYAAVKVAFKVGNAAGDVGRGFLRVLGLGLERGDGLVPDSARAQIRLRVFAHVGGELDPDTWTMPAHYIHYGEYDWMSPANQATALELRQTVLAGFGEEQLPLTHVQQTAIDQLGIAIDRYDMPDVYEAEQFGQSLVRALDNHTFPIPIAPAINERTMIMLGRFADRNVQFPNMDDILFSASGDFERFGSVIARLQRSTYNDDGTSLDLFTFEGLNSDAIEYLGEPVPLFNKIDSFPEHADDGTGIVSNRGVTRLLNCQKN